MIHKRSYIVLVLFLCIIFLVIRVNSVVYQLFISELVYIKVNCLSESLTS